MKDAYSRTVPLAIPFEIKRANGGVEDAQVQLAVFHASAFAFLAENGVKPVEMLPMVSWAIIGHEWKPSISVSYTHLTLPTKRIV